MQTRKIGLTEDRVKSLKALDGRETFIYDAKQGGLGIRCYPANRRYPEGRKVYFIRYRVGSGRRATQRRLPIGLTNEISLEDARKTARQYLGEVAAGGDPQAVRRESLRAKNSTLDKALVQYDGHLKRRKVVNRETILSTLQRGLAGPLGKIDLAAIDRRSVADQVSRLDEAGKPGAAQDLRAKASAFLNWAVDRGYLTANPLAGWRRERATRAQRVNRKGRALSDAEIRAIWSACNNVPAPFGDYVKVLLLLGQRRGETARMQWPDVDLNAAVWTIPAEVTKNGREHRVPLPDPAIAILRTLLPDSPSFRTVRPLVFRGRDNKVMSGWTQRVGGLVAESGVKFTLHDCRRTFRSGLSRLGVDDSVAELMLNHARADLVEAYDRDLRESARWRAATLWADHVAAAVEAGLGGAKVTSLGSRRF